MKALACASELHQSATNTCPWLWYRVKFPDRHFRKYRVLIRSAMLYSHKSPRCSALSNHFDRFCIIAIVLPTESTAGLHKSVTVTIVSLISVAMAWTRTFEKIAPRPQCRLVGLSELTRPTYPFGNTEGGGGGGAFPNMRVPVNATRHDAPYALSAQAQCVYVDLIHLIHGLGIYFVDTHFYLFQCVYFVQCNIAGWLCTCFALIPFSSIPPSSENKPDFFISPTEETLPLEEFEKSFIQRIQFHHHYLQ